MKKTIALLFLTVLSFLSFAQDVISEDSLFQDPTERKAHIFEHLTLPVILWENGMPLIEMSRFDGVIHDSIIATPNVFGLAYASIYAIPKPANEQLQEPLAAYSNVMSNLNSKDVIPIVALHYSYDRLVSTAIEDSILFIDNEQLKEMPGNTLSPYESITSFLSTPMLEQIYTSTPKFIIQDQYYFGNTGKVLQSAYIDFDNGNGLQQYSLNTNIEPVYTSPGEKTLRIQYHFTDGTMLNNYSKIVVAFDDPNKNLGGSDDFTLEYTTSNPSNGTQVQVFVNYNCFEDGVRKPLIFVEGFNPPELGEDELQDTTDWWNNFFFPNTIESFNLFFEIDDEGYDMIYINYLDGGADINHNAAAVREAIEWINTEKNNNGGNEPNVLIGSSMGGLVGKLALRNMEIAKLDHQTELFVSIDTPFRGANVPLGVQYAAYDLPTANVAPFLDLEDFNPIIGDGIVLLERPATQQMLIVQKDLTNQYTSFLDDFHALGDLQQAREIAISNGSQLSNTQSFNPHQKMLDVTAFSWIPLALIGTGTVTKVEVWALPDHPADYEKIYRANIYTQIFSIPVSFHHHVEKIKDIYPVDSAPGGYFGYDLDIQDNFSNVGWFLINTVLGLNIGNTGVDNFCFIPSVSSLDIDSSLDIVGVVENELDLQYDISNNLARVTDGTTHFKNYIGETLNDENGFANHSHEDVTNRNSQLLRFEMIGAGSNFPAILIEDFNFGAAQRDGVNFLTVDHFRTKNRIMENLLVAGAELSINKNEKIGYVS